MASRTTTNRFCVDCFEFEWPKICIDFCFGNIFEAFICIHNSNDRQQRAAIWSECTTGVDNDSTKWIRCMMSEGETKWKKDTCEMRMRSIFRHRIASKSQRRAPNEMDSFGTKPKNCTEKLKVIFESSKNIVPSWRRHFSDRSTRSPRCQTLFACLFIILAFHMWFLLLATFSSPLRLARLFALCAIIVCICLPIRLLIKT